VTREAASESNYKVPNGTINIVNVCTRITDNLFLFHGDLVALHKLERQE
jgi:repressor of nif and glnA expression